MKNIRILSALVMILAMSMSFISCSSDDSSDKKKGDDEPKTTTVYVTYKISVNRDDVNCDLEQYSLADEIDNLEANAATIVGKVLAAQGGKVDADYSKRYSFTGKQEAEVQTALKNALNEANASLVEASTTLGGKYTCVLSSSTVSYDYASSFQSTDINLKQALFATFKSGDLKFQALPNNHAAVITEESLDSYDSSTYKGDITVPSTVTDNGTTYTVTAIGPKAFYAGKSITSITLPNTITTICKDAFEYNYVLAKINIPGSVKKFVKGIQDTIEMFDGKKLTEVTLGDGLTVLPDYIFDSNASLTKIVVPGSLTTIPHACFCDCSSLADITIGDGVQTIGSFAFSSVGIKTLDFLPATVTTIDDEAFTSCASLETIDLKDGLTTVGNGAFKSTKSLKKVTFPSTVTSIGYCIFNGSDCAIDEIHMKGTTPAKLATLSDKDTFTSIPSTCKIYVPTASVDAYKAADVWKNYASQIVGE